MEPPRTAPFTRGQHLNVEMVVLGDGRVPADEFLAQFTPANGKSYAHRKRLEAAIHLVANTRPGTHVHRDAFKKVQGSNGLFEFKAFQLRLLCFYGPDRRLILLFGVIKKDDYLDPPDVRRAQKMRDEFVAALERAQGTKNHGRKR